MHHLCRSRPMVSLRPPTPLPHCADTPHSCHVSGGRQRLPRQFQSRHRISLRVVETHSSLESSSLSSCPMPPHPLRRSPLSNLIPRSLCITERTRQEPSDLRGVRIWYISPPPRRPEVLFALIITFIHSLPPLYSIRSLQSLIR
ncbi:hypothetical protein MPH_07916 [Macrophomina phaseolina MS6]|uniref:Uncharacterized protein n=1 Tax=Macrophomina phaseolina (strain MS6) TaxID=1126212 RepID=K2QY76_MACPH|nr:hypothetical protein MPH_07916 [Macrophomina phaseolina MS6]